MQCRPRDGTSLLACHVSPPLANPPPDAQGLFVGAAILSYLAVYSPIIRKLDITIKRSRSMLLLFPTEVTQSVVGIRNAMASYCKSVWNK
jgi:hypothetical protein